MTQSTWVRLAGLTKTCGAVRAVDDLSLEVAPGEVVALLGPDGAGTSTTVDLLLALAAPRPAATAAAVAGRLFLSQGTVRNELSSAIAQDRHPHARGGGPGGPGPRLALTACR